MFGTLFVLRNSFYSLHTSIFEMINLWQAGQRCNQPACQTSPLMMFYPKE